jgi:hypothetical protein
MTVTRQALKTNNASKKTGSTTKSGKRERAGGKTARKDGTEQLRQAADERVGLNSEKLADLLTEKALKGDLACAKALVALAEGKKPIPEPVKKRRGPGLAARLASEPQWRGEEEGRE